MKYTEGDPNELKQTFWKALANSPFVMLELDAQPHSAAPMTAQLDKEAHHAIWFFAGRDSHWSNLGAASAAFASKGHDVFARFEGRLVEETDPKILDEHWSNVVESWFPRGKADPNLLFLRMDLGDAAIWSGDLGLLAGAKMALGLSVRDEVAGTFVETRL
ncbi:MAG: pyridoxamine 5'-phosphate oxidase family protein [Novosphingobium sp.]